MSKDELIARYIDDSELRRQTFVEGWPSAKSYLSIDEFVRQGFYCVGEGDKVQCVYCKGYLKSWAPNDDILLEHRKHFPQCPFILHPYKYQEFRDYQARLRSLADWPTQLRQKPEDLARAGMFYMGKGDQTQCFWCGGILMDWEPGDIPVLEHAKHFKQCLWLEVIRDSKFFKEAKMGYVASSKHAGSQESAAAMPIPESTGTCILPETQARHMGFNDDIIEKAKEKCGTGSNFTTEKLMKAILDLEEVKTREVKPLSDDTKTVDMKMLSVQKSSDFDPSCKICMEEDFDVVFLPCGHLLSCEKCAKSLKNCPMCRRTIEVAKKVFM